MARVKRGTNQRRRHNKILKAAKGFRGLSGRLYSIAKRRVMKAGMHAYAHRRRKKRDFRRLWIARVNAASRAQGLSYSQLMYRLSKKMVALDRKMLSEIAIHEPAVFDKIVAAVK
ncbi:50S ribosomal protein L20 [Candidatus Peregrinibacteria bacterium]|nr:MAG: 50S ribosomal protein L20 [Candidatus Peregrinibacteria bacterium]